MQKHFRISLLIMLALCAGIAAQAQSFRSLIKKDLAGWKTRHSANGWKNEKGVLINAMPSSDLITEEKFWNFELRYEYKVPPGGNSGVYLRGRYEIQVLDDYGKEPHPGSNGAIYGKITPKVNASKPADQWQSVEVKLIENRVTVKLNGTVIIDNQEIDGPTGGALDDRVNEPGPLMLQGDHGPISYRNIRIKVLPGKPGGPGK